jgi:transcriptional regulator EpsA
MQAGEYQPTAEFGCSQPPLLEPGLKANGVMSPNASLLDPLDLEALMLNIEASLRVHARDQLFTWTQGLLQSLVKHELLVCNLRGAEAVSSQVDSFAVSLQDPGRFSDMFRQDTSVVPRLIKTWEDNHFLPVVCETGEGSPFADSAFARELTRIGASNLLAHGTHDVLGKAVSFFIFACQTRTVGPRQAHFAELLVPYLHLAWVRSQINRPFESAATGLTGAALLTQREREILRWVHLGKSNIEIGAILGISSLTVKNHVQKILRKLNAQNRTQAVGKAIALRILSI